MKKEINVFDYAKEIMQALSDGILVTTKADGKINSMSISWGSIGIEWNLPIFTIYVREGRYTKELLDKNPEFTINIPLDKQQQKVIGYCGSKSGRTVDKIKELDLNLIDANNVSVPAIMEFSLTLECKVIYQQPQPLETMSDCLKQHYPQDVASDAPLANKDFHIAYYGHIVSAYIIE